MTGEMPCWQAGSGEPVVVISDGGAVPTRAHALLAGHRRVLVFTIAPPAEVGAAVAALGLGRFDLIGEGAGAAAALSLAKQAEVGAIVLATPDGAPDPGFAGIEQPVLVLCGTNGPSAATERWRALLPDCHFMFVYDAGGEIGAERPEALAYIAHEFFERRGLFLVSRESGVTLP